MYWAGPLVMCRTAIWQTSPQDRHSIGGMYSPLEGEWRDG